MEIMNNCLHKVSFFITILFFCFSLFLFVNLSPLLAKSNLKFVSVNNQRVEVNEKNEVEVVHGDAVRISGTMDLESEVEVYMEEEELKPVVVVDDYWYVLFSITEMEDGEYVVTVKDGNEEQFVVNLVVVGEKSREILQASDIDSTDRALSREDSKEREYGILFVTGMIIVGLLAVLYFYSKESKTKAKRDKK